MSPVTRRRYCLGLLLAALTAWATLALAASPPDPSAGIQEWEVKRGRYGAFNEPFSFGPYGVTGLDQGWPGQAAPGRSAFHFTLKGPAGRPSSCRCAAGLGRREAKALVGDLAGRLEWSPGGEADLACRDAMAGGVGWRLALTRVDAVSAPRGLIGAGGRAWRVEGMRRAARPGFPAGLATGYTFIAEGRTVGAVQLMGAGLVWLEADLDAEAREALAAAAAALLIAGGESRP